MGSQGKRVRLAILMADTPLPGTVAKYKTYGGVFHHLFERALAPTPVSAVLDISYHDVVNEPASAYPDPDAIDGVLISGSKHSAFESDDWIVRLVQYTRRCLEGGRVRVLGVCFGHQIIGRAMDIPVERSPKGWEVSVTNVDLTEEGKRIFGIDKLRIHQMHRDVVVRYPPTAIPLAQTGICPVQGMLIPKRALTVQGHPEFTDGIVREILELRHDSGIFPDELFKDAMGRVENEQDGVFVARAFVKFLQES